VELKAVCSASGARGKSYGIRFGAAYCCSDYNQMLADPGVDAIFIVSRNQRHAAEALAALEAGKHVFVEKPMALTEEECRTLVRAVERTGRHLSVGFQPPLRAVLPGAEKAPGGAIVTGGCELPY